MHLCIHGFLSEDDEDDSLKFFLELDESRNIEISQLLGHKNLNAMSEGEWLMTDEQVAMLSTVIGKSLPNDLDLFIGFRL